MLTVGEPGPVEVTLDAMAAGGIHDQIGGGFARYSVDPIWLVPHFEKMLYDNALLARVYLHGWQALGKPRWREVCERTLDWALREMRGEEGGFLSALDADSEGEEGKFYVWTPDEVREALTEAGIADEAAAEVIAYYGITDAGNFEGRNIPNLIGRPGAAAPAALEAARAALYEARAKRVWPGIDDKRLASWNALMIAALADAGAVLGREDYLDAARGAAAFVLERMRDGEGRLLRTWKDGEARLNAYLEDHAYLVEALLTLYEATFEERWFVAARETADAMIDRFADPERGGFFTTSSDHEQLIARRKDIDDHPIPSGSSSAAFGLLRLAALTGERRYSEHAESVFRLLAKIAETHPQAVAHLIRAIDFHLSPVKRGRARLGRRRRARRACRRRPFRVPAAPRPRRRRRGHRYARADGRPDRGRGPRRRVRVRELHLPDAGDRTGGAVGTAGLGSPDARIADRDRPRAADAVGGAGERLGGAARPRGLRREPGHVPMQRAGRDLGRRPPRHHRDPAE